MMSPTYSASALLLPLFLAQGSVDDRVHSIFSRFDKPDSPGAAVAVIQDGEIVLAEGYGSAQLEFEAPITPETVFHVASVSKQFTAFAVCLLAAEGKLSLEDPIQEHLPEVPDFGHRITLKHLLHHTSGLRDQWVGLSVAGWRMDDVITTEHVMTFVRNQRELNFEPGEEFMYCNTGYTLLGQVVARVSGQGFPDFCQERIFDPLGMESTHFHDDHEHLVPGRAYSYVWEEKEYRNGVLSYANAGATSLFTTAIDLLFWLQNFETGDVGGPEVQALLRETYVLNDGTEGTYGLGVFLEPFLGHATISHSGGDAGFNSHVVWFPEQKLGVAVVANMALDASGYANRVARLFVEPRPTPEEGKREPERDEVAEVVLDEAALERFAGTYRRANGTLVHVQRRAQALVFLEHEPRVALALSPTEFEFRGTRALFRSDPGGRITAMTLDRRGKTEDLPRLELDSPPRLADYTGRYWSEELGTHYDLSLEDGVLIARHRRHGTLTLTRRGPDFFQSDRWFFGSVAFTRDAEGRVDGFRIHGGRIRNLAFARRD